MSKKYPKSNLEKLRTKIGLTQKKLAEEIGYDVKTYRMCECMKQDLSAAMLKKLIAAFRDHGENVSADYLLGLSDFTSPENDFIGNQTGLSDRAIMTLRDMKQIDDDNRLRVDPLPSGLPIINAILSATMEDIQALLSAINLYLHPEYKIPVRHDANSENGYSVNDHPRDQTIISNYLIGEDGKTYIQHLAKNKKTPSDNIAVPITEDYIKAVAINELNLALEHIMTNQTAQ